MQAGNIGCAGQAFAIASSNESGGKKSRIRRSKEERKSMAESFIKKYQESNNGNFPSLNLAHKEVGGSFYTVREIVREIIQENRVLAPPRVSLEEHGLSGVLEQHPLGSISMEPIIDLSASDRGHIIETNEIQFSSAANGDSDRTSESYHESNHFQDKSMEEVSNSPQSKSHKFEESIVNGFSVDNGSPLPDKPLITSADHHVDIDEEPESQMLCNEQYHIKNDQTVDKDSKFGQRIQTGPTAIGTLDQEKLEAQHVVESFPSKSLTNSGIVVETFPLRPVPKTINMVEESGKLHEAAETSEDKGAEQHKKTITQSSSSFISDKSDEKLPHSTVELNGENSDVKVVHNPQDPSFENAKHSSGDIEELEFENSLPDGAKASSSTKTSISEDSTTAGGKSSDRDNSSEAKGNNPTLDRINLETWERAANKSHQSESNPLLALIKAMISSFVKFWTQE